MSRKTIKKILLVCIIVIIADMLVCVTLPEDVAGIVILAVPVALLTMGFLCGFCVRCPCCGRRMKLYGMKECPKCGTVVEDN